MPRSKSLLKLVKHNLHRSNLILRQVTSLVLGIYVEEKNLTLCHGPVVDYARTSTFSSSGSAYANLSESARTTNQFTSIGPVTETNL